MGGDDILENICKKFRTRIKQKKTGFCKKNGFTLVEVIVDIAVVALVAMAVLSGFMAAYRAIEYSKAKISAVALANEKMEIIRNMPYDDLATQNGAIYPPGDILDEEMVVRKNFNFTVHTTIRYVDDPYDGDALGEVPEKPVDIYPYDYKKARIEVFLEGRSIALSDISTDISASAAETPTNTGIFYLCIIDAVNNPVSAGDVLITNDEVDPPVNIVAVTDANGCILVPGLPPDSHNNYHIEVTKDGYSTDMTYPRTPQNPNQIQPDIDIIAQQVTRLTLAIDKVSTLIINTLDLTGAPIPSLSLHIESSKEIYFNPSTYKYSEDHSTDLNGYLELAGMEWDDYKITMNSDGFYIISSSPVLPVHLNPDSTQIVNLYVSIDSSSPRIYGIAPVSGVIPDITTVDISGENFDDLPIVKLVNPLTAQEITGTNIDVDSQGEEIIVDFDLSLATAGLYDVYVENPGGSYARQEDGFTVESR